MATDGRISARQVAYTGGAGMSATDVEAALDELAAEKSDVGHSHSASGITVQDENGLVATGVTQLDFQGAGVTAGAGTGEVVVTITGGGSATGSGEVLMQDGVTAPPVPLETEDQTDWLYQG